MRIPTRDKLAKMAGNDQELIRFLEGLGSSGASASIADGNYGDITVTGAAWQINPGSVGLTEVDGDVLSRQFHTGVQAISTVAGLQAALDGKQPVGSYATAAQGALAGTALQPGDLGLSGVATITVPGWRRSHTQTIAAPGVTALDRIIASLGAMGPTYQNTAELLDIAALSAVAGADTITFTAAFTVPASGPIPINWSAS